MRIDPPPYGPASFPDPTPLPRSLGLIAFCGRDWRTGVQFGRPGLLVHLIKTYFGLRRYVSHVRVAVADDADLALVRALPFAIDVVRVAAEPQSQLGRPLLPVGTAALGSLDADGFDYVFYTEADQVVFLRDTAALLEVLDEGESYAVPHRLERDFRGANRRGQPLVRFGGDDYVLWNAPEPLAPVRTAREGWFAAGTPRVAYGAAWVARADLVARADFLAPTPEPLEQACHAMFHAHAALKSDDVSRFFVVHLGGLDNALAAAGLDPAQFPLWW
jgi:hypothetical protein